MQEIWKTGLEWDQLLPEELVLPYFSWRKSLVLLRDISVPRCVLPDPSGQDELHLFCDASELAYGAVIYVRQVHGVAKVCTVNFLTAKSKVAPVKTQSIPRLELCGAVVGIRLLQGVMFVLRRFKHPTENFRVD